MLSLQQMKTQQSIKGAHSIIVTTSADLHKVIKSLQKMLKEQKQKKEKAEQALQQFRERTLKRQGQFCTIIAKLKQYNSVIIKQNPEINRLFATIWANFDMFNKKSVELLQQKYEDVVQHMTRKVDTIMKYTKAQLAENNKKLNMDLQNIQQQIQQVYKIAITIEDKNIQMAEVVKKLNFQLKVLKEEKAMIIQDTVQRKYQVKSLVSQNQRLNDQLLKLRLELSNKQMFGHKEDKVESKQGNNSQIKLLLTKRSQSKAQQEVVEDKGKKIKGQVQLSKHKSQLYSFETVKMNHINRMETLQYMKDNKDTDKKQSFLNSTISFTPRSANTKILSQKQKNTSTFVTNRRSSQIKSRRCSSIFGQANDSIPIIQGITLNTLNQRTPQPTKASVGKQHYERTISHLQRCVKRQKQRSHSLMKFVNSLLSKSKQINETLQRIFKQEQESKDTNKLERIMKSEKLIQVLRILKQRLGALQKMDVNCGWGDVIAEI